MEKKYSLTNESKVVDGHTVYRVIAEKDFGGIKKGTLGGFVESENNLSHEGNCWVYDNALIYGNAKVFDNAQIHYDVIVLDNAIVCNSAIIYDNAIVFDSAKVFDNAKIYGDTKIYDSARVCDNVKVHGDAEIFGNAKVYGDAEIFGDAKVYGDTIVYGNAEIYNSAQIYGNAEIFGNAKICGNAKIYGDAKVYDRAGVWGDAKIYDTAKIYGHSRIYNNAIINQGMWIENASVNCALSANLAENVRCQTGLLVVDNRVTAYKQINKNMTSFYDNDFKYEVGKVIEAENVELSNKSCAGGLHFSNANYWNLAAGSNTGYLMAEINIEDIITVQQGKIRCKRAKILGTYNI